MKSSFKNSCIVVNQVDNEKMQNFFKISKLHKFLEVNFIMLDAKNSASIRKSIINRTSLFKKVQMIFRKVFEIKKGYMKHQQINGVV